MSATEAALRHVARRARTVAELRNHLERHGFLPEEVAAAVQELRHLGYLDDLSLSARYAEWSLTGRPMGRSRIVRELSRRGVDRETIARALEKVFGPVEEARALAAALRKAVGRYPGQVDDKQRRRIASHLLRRGFEASEITAAMEALTTTERGEEAGA